MRLWSAEVPGQSVRVRLSPDLRLGDDEGREKRHGSRPPFRWFGEAAGDRRGELEERLTRVRVAVPRARPRRPSRDAGSQGMRTQARQREAKCSSIRSDVDVAALCSDAVQGGDRGGGEIAVAVLFEPVERRACGARAVEARRTDEHELVGSVEDALRRRAQHPGRRCRDRRGCSGARAARPPAGRPRARARLRSRGARRPRSPRAGSMPGSCRRERPRTCRAQPRSRRSVATVSAVSRRSRCPSVPGVGVRVERDDPVSAMESEGVAHEQAGRRLADAALARDERDLAAARDRRLDLRDQLAPAQLGGAGTRPRPRLRWRRRPRGASRPPAVEPSAAACAPGVKSAAVRRGGRAGRGRMPSPPFDRVGGGPRPRASDRHDVVLVRPEASGGRRRSSSSCRRLRGFAADGVCCDSG